MSTAQAGAVGYAPIVTVGITEKSKYEQMWKHQQYREVAPGEGIAATFLEKAQPKVGSEVIDFGAGTGRGALMLAIMGMKVHMLDFASNCLDEDVQNALTTQAHVLSFTEHDLTKEVPVTAPYGFCTDVMEHIPPEQVDQVLANILHAAQNVFFQISCEDDVCGALIGHPLHLSVHDYKWWDAKFKAFDCLTYWSGDFGSHCMFYVSAWQPGRAIVDAGIVNVAEDKILANVKANIAGDWLQITPHELNDVDVMILAGGPSLEGQLETIRQLRQEGVKLITLNGTYNWALERGLVPSAQVVVDARPHNSRFVRPVVPDCKYFIASQVDPTTLEGLPADRTYLWHTNVAVIKEILDARYQTWWNTPGGSTVLLRSIPLLLMLGFRRFHLFGADSCLTDDGRHHSYSQPENDGMMVFPVYLGGRKFLCHPWMYSQAQEMMDLIKFYGHAFELEIHGDGLIKHILTTGAEMADLEIDEDEDASKLA